MIMLMTVPAAESSVLTNHARKVFPLRCILITITSITELAEFFTIWTGFRFGSRYRSRVGSRVRSRLRFKFGSVVVRCGGRWGGTAGRWGVDVTVQLY